MLVSPNTLTPGLATVTHPVELSQHWVEFNTVVLANVHCSLRAVPGILRLQGSSGLSAALIELTVSSEGVSIQIPAKTQKCESWRELPGGNHTVTGLLSLQGSEPACRDGKVLCALSEGPEQIVRTSSFSRLCIHFSESSYKKRNCCSHMTGSESQVTDYGVTLAGAEPGCRPQFTGTDEQDKAAHACCSD